MWFAKRDGRANSAAEMRRPPGLAGFALGCRRPRRQGRQPESLAYRSERLPVRFACTKPSESFVMSWHRVALMTPEAAAGVADVEGPHDGVTLDFRENGGGGDAG